MSIIKNLRFSYENFTLDIPHWEFQDQGVQVIYGSSGSGKTTLFNILLGLLKAPGMEWIYKNKDISLLEPFERGIGVVFQTLDLFPHMTGFENIVFASNAKKMKKQEFIKKYDFLTQIMGLDPFIHQSVLELSGGQKQRVAIARALIWSPEFLFLDEPFSALDLENKNAIKGMIKNIVNENDLTVLMITHDLDEIQNFANQKHQISHGRFV